MPTEKIGAPNQTNLETASLHSILDELEEWQQYLKAEPEVIHKLRAFEAAANKRDSEPKQPVRRPARLRGPSL